MCCAIMSALIGTLLFMAAAQPPVPGPLAIEPAPFEQLLVFEQIDYGQ